MHGTQNAGRAPLRHPSSTTRAIAPLLAVNFVATLGFSIVLPFLVYLVTRLGGNAVVYGATAAAYSLFQLPGAPLLGRWSDRYGRKRLLLVSQVGTALSWGLFLLALTLPASTITQVHSRILGAFTLTVPLVILIGARALDGITGGNASVTNAYLADLTEEPERVSAFGRLAMSSNLGLVVGPALAGLLGATAWGERAPVVVAFALSIAACVMIVVGLPDAPAVARPISPRRATPPRALGQEPKDCFEGTAAARPPLTDALRLAGVPRLLAMNVLVFLAFNLFYVAFPIYVVQRLAWTLAETGAFFAVLSLIMVLVQGPVLTHLARRWSGRALVMAGSLILAVSFLAFQATATVSLYAGAAALALGNGLMWPSLLALLADAAGDAQGAAQGLAGSGSALASIVGLLVGGVLFEQIGTHVFVLAAAITLIPAVLAPGAPERGRRARAVALDHK